MLDFLITLVDTILEYKWYILTNYTTICLCYFIFNKDISNIVLNNKVDTLDNTIDKIIEVIDGELQDDIYENVKHILENYNKDDLKQIYERLGDFDYNEFIEWRNSVSGDIGVLSGSIFIPTESSDSD